MVISFSGIDSSGKSTQIKMLKEFCDNRNIRNTVKWSKARATPGVVLIKQIFRRDRNMGHEEKLQNREKFFANTRKKTLLLFASLFELCFYWGIYYRILAAVYPCLILDRYLWDSYVEICVDFYGVDFRRWRIWKLLTKVALRPDCSILLVVPLEVSLARDIDKTDITVRNPAVIDSIERKTKKINIYFNLIDEKRWDYVIDGTKSREVVHHEILSVTHLKG